MSFKISPPPTTTQKPVLVVKETESPRGTAETTVSDRTQPKPTEEAQATTSAVDTSATSALVEVGREEAQRLHNEMLEDLRSAIASGSYQADMDVVAERVAEVLGVA